MSTRLTDAASGVGPLPALPGQETILVCWSALAKLSVGARVTRSPTVAAAVFPSWLPLNNAIMLTGPADPAATVSELAPAYADAGVDVWALWLPSRTTDFDAPDEVQSVGGLERDTTTLVMDKDLTPSLRYDDRVVRTSIDTLKRVTDDEPVPRADLEQPESASDLSAWVMVVDELAVSCAWTFLHHGDCGIYAVGTLPGWRRRGFARALMEHVLADAWHKGARTASLQSTRMGQPLYESLGFTAVGRYEEWISL